MRSLCEVRRTTARYASRRQNESAIIRSLRDVEPNTVLHTIAPTAFALPTTYSALIVAGELE